MSVRAVVELCQALARPEGPTLRRLPLPAAGERSPSFLFIPPVGLESWREDGVLPPTGQSSHTWT